ncbi:MAG: aspartate kinase [Fluviicola sp.]|nr:aspartate kinase [Fluviicola sp.]
MKVFKFGGASVKDAASIRNIAKLLSLYKGEKLAIVISAMGKNTNAFEKIVEQCLTQNEVNYLALIAEREKFHLDILSDLITDASHPVFEEIQSIFNSLRIFCKRNSQENENALYAEIVSTGEILSTNIVNAFLRQEGFNSHWKDARKLVRTENKFLDANVDWEQTQQLFEKDFLDSSDSSGILLTQGFIGHNSDNQTTTLGREGSDFSAAIVAHCCNAESVTIWKDVPGMLNADPKLFDNTVKLDKISFREAIELSYYGASVIHPKTIKPLQNKSIPLYVKSFLNPDNEGTTIHSCTKSDTLIPSFIFKKNQLLFSISPKDFSFIEEQNLSAIFSQISSLDLKINVMQNSALSFSVLVDEEKVNLEQFLSLFSKNYHVKYNSGLELITIRHYNQETIDRLTLNKSIILQQLTRETARIIVAS